MASRSMWTGTVGFGMVNIPVKLHAAVGKEETGLHQVRKSDGSRIRYQRVAEADGQVVADDEVTSGWETGTGQVVIVTDDDKKSAGWVSDKAMKILTFIDAASVPPRPAMDSSYYAEPGKGGEKAYELLQLAMERTGKVAVVSVSIRDREARGLLYPAGEGFLALERLQWAEYVRVPDFAAPRTGVTDAEVDMAVSLIATLNDEFDWRAAENEPMKALEKVIQGKAETGQVVGDPAVRAPGAVTPTADLFAALAASVEQAKASRPAPPKTRAPRKSRAKAPAA